MPDIYVHDGPGLAPPPLYFFEFFKKDASISARSFSAFKILTSARSFSNSLISSRCFRLPRHSSFMIMHTFADWGRVRHNRAEILGITTVSTTKAHGRIGVNAKVWGEIFSSNELLTGNVIELVTMKMRKKYKNYCNFSEF